MPSRALSALLLLAVVAGCDSSQTFDAAALAGTYTGTNTITESDGFALTEPVTATVEVNGAGGTITLTRTVGNGPDEVLVGTFDESGARFEIETSVSTAAFEVDADGDISGAGEGGFDGTTYDIVFSGQLTPGTYDLTTVVTTMASPNPDRVGFTTTSTMTTERD